MRNDEQEPLERIDEPRRPTCKVCLERFDDPVPEGPRRPTGLFDPGAVRGATDGKEGDGARHAAHKAGLRHWYKLTTMIPCSFPDKTPHGRGFVVETLCGRVVNIGKDCGRSNVIGLDEVIAYAGEQEQRAVDIMAVQAQPDELVARAEIISKDVILALAFKDRLADKLPEIVFEMQRRAGTGNWRVQVKHVVERTREDGSKYKEEAVEEETLRGVELWTDTIAPDLHKQGEALRADITADLLETPDPDHEQARRLARRVERFDVLLQRASDWLSRIRTFFSDRNLALAAYAGNRPDVKVDREQFIFVDKERKRTCALGLRGLYLR